MVKSWVRLLRKLEKTGNRNEKLFRIIDYHTKNVKHLAQDAIFAEVFFETIKIAIKRPIPSGFQFARTAPNQFISTTLTESSRNSKLLRVLLMK